MRQRMLAQLPGGCVAALRLSRLCLQPACFWLLLLVHAARLLLAGHRQAGRPGAGRVLVIPVLSWQWQHGCCGML